MGGQEDSSLSGTVSLFLLCVESTVVVYNVITVRFCACFPADEMKANDYRAWFTYTLEDVSVPTTPRPTPTTARPAAGLDSKQFKVRYNPLMNYITLVRHRQIFHEQSLTIKSQFVIQIWYYCTDSKTLILGFIFIQYSNTDVIMAVNKW